MTTTSIVQGLNRQVPQDLASRLFWLPDQARATTVWTCAPPGAGKTRLITLTTFQDAVRGAPCLVMDPTGGCIDGLLWQIARQPREVQKELWPRVRYVNCAGSGEYVMPMPLYTRLGDESLYDVSQRILDVWRRSDQALASASILGWNSLHPLATATGILLTAMGYQVTEAADLVRNLEAWTSRIAETVARYPETGVAARFFTEEFMPLRPYERLERARSFLVKLGAFNWDSRARASYGASTPAIDLQEVVRRRLVVLFDFRQLYDTEQLRFTMIWLFRSVVDFIRRRGPSHYHLPLVWVIDELTALLNPATLDEHLLAADLEELIARLARSHRVFLTVANQAIEQLPERVQHVLMNVGTAIFGSITDFETALRVARRFNVYRPYFVKKTEPVYGSVQGFPTVIDHRTVEFSADEQDRLAALPLTRLPRFTFLVAASPAEGTVPSTLRRISIAPLDRGRYVNEEAVARIREILMRKHGRRINDVLAEIAARCTPQVPKTTRVVRTIS